VGHLGAAFWEGLLPPPPPIASTWPALATQKTIASPDKIAAQADPLALLREWRSMTFLLQTRAARLVGQIAPVRQRAIIPISLDGRRVDNVSVTILSRIPKRQNESKDC